MRSLMVFLGSWVVLYLFLLIVTNNDLGNGEMYRSQATQTAGVICETFGSEGSRIRCCVKGGCDAE